MKHIYQLLSFILLTVFLTSCQKGYYPDPVNTTGNGGSGGGSGSVGPLLVKIESFTTKGTTTSSFTYNQSNKLVSISIDGTINTNTLTVSQRWELVRNAQDRVTRYTFWESNSTLGDTTVFDLHYPAGSDYFDYAVSTTDFFGITIKDSITYTVSAGKVTKVDKYLDIMTGYQLMTSTLFGYDAKGNIISENMYTNDLLSGDLLLTTSKTYEFDDAISVMHMGQEAFLFNSSFFSVNNARKVVYKDFGSGTGLNGTTTISYDYKYNNLNKPASFTITSIGNRLLAQSGTGTFTYQ